MKWKKENLEKTKLEGAEGLEGLEGGDGLDDSPLDSQSASQ